MTERCDDPEAKEEVLNLTRHPLARGREPELRLAARENGRPAVRQPELGPLVPTCLNKAKVVAAGDGPRRKAERFEPDLVPGALVVECETGSRVPDLIEAAGEVDPGGRQRRRLDLELRRLIGGQQGIHREDMLDVHQDQLLMLLLVVDAEPEQSRDAAPLRFSGSLDQPGHRRAYVVAISHDNIDRRPRQQAALGSRVTWAGRLVI